VAQPKPQAPAQPKPVAQQPAAPKPVEAAPVAPVERSVVDNKGDEELDRSSDA
jgi:hypothetical protein